VSRKLTKTALKLALTSAVLALLCTTGAFAAEILTGQPLVILDPGHSKMEPGLGNGSGQREFLVTLELAHHLAGLLSDTCRPLLARSSKDAVPEEAAQALANRNKADLFLSLHLHGRASAQPRIFYFDLPKATGTDTWQTRALRSQTASKRLARTIANTIKADQPGTRPVVLSGPILPLEGINMPGILVEPFALSQIPESPDQRSRFLQTQARPIADAVLAFLADQSPGD